MSGKLFLFLFCEDEREKASGVARCSLSNGCGREHLP